MEGASKGYTKTATEVGLVIVMVIHEFPIKSDVRQVSN